MLQSKFCLIIAATFALALAGCGGSGGDAAPRIQFTSQVVFGDSLSDVGTYAVGGILALGGGRYTVNSTLPDGSPEPTNWTEIIAKGLVLPAPCPAETGLEGYALLDFNVPKHFYSACTNYAQGGAMVTYPYGAGNAHTQPFPNGNPVTGSAVLGQLTVPVVRQINNHLAAHGGSFTGTEIVFLLAGGNDAILNTLIYASTVEDGGLHAAPAAANAAVQAMTTAGRALAGYINNLILAKGAKYVVVLNLPGLSAAPFGAEVETKLPGTKALITQMVTAFNSQLKANLPSQNVLLADLNAATATQMARPADFGLTNVTDSACNLSPRVNLLSSSLICNASNVTAGDISHYAFADQIHPTPYGNFLIALFVAQQLADKGWL